MRVEDANIEDEYIVVKSSTSILKVSQKIAETAIPDAIVVDDDDKAIGALDDYDIVSKVIALEKDVNTTTAKDIMYAPPPVYLNTELDEVYEILQRLGATVLPVVDKNKRLLGVITIHDVLERKAIGRRSLIDKLLGR